MNQNQNAFWIILGERGKRKGGINVSISTFIPKPHTPFQWEPQLPLAEIEERHKYLKNVLRGKGVRLKWNDARISFLEGVFSRGDRRLGEVLLKAHYRGCKFDGWTEHLRWCEWEEAFAEAGINPLFYTDRKREFSEILPWGHLSCGVEGKFLIEEWEKAMDGTVASDCRGGECLRCGVCGGKVNMALSDSTISLTTISRSSNELVNKRPWVKKIRSQFIKVGKARVLGHLEMIDVFVRAARRAGISLKFSEGFHPMPRISFTNPLPVGMESLVEFMDLELARYMRADEFKERLNRELPSELRILDAREMTTKGNPLPIVFEIDRFLISLENLGRDFPEDTLKNQLQQFLNREEFTLIQDKKKGVRKVNALPFVERLRLIEKDFCSPSVPIHAEAPSVKEHFQGEVLIEIGIKREGGVRPAELLQSILRLTQEETKLLRVVKTESLPPLL